MVLVASHLGEGPRRRPRHEVVGELTLGMTVCDFRFRSGKPANVEFAMDADEPKFVAMLTEILGRTA